MHCYRDGHNYTLEHIDGDGYEHLKFINRYPGIKEAGTNNQEVLRVLINRVQFLESEMHWDGNDKILYHLRAALVLHEARHLERLVERGELKSELVETGDDGHFKIIRE